MEAGHHRPAAVALDHDRLHVHHAVAGTHAGAEHEQHQAQGQRRGGDGEQGQSGDHHHQRGDHHGAAAVARSEHACDRHRQQRTGTQAQQHQAERAFIQAGAVLGERDQRGPGSGGEAGQEEGGAGGVLLAAGKQGGRSRKCRHGIRGLSAAQRAGGRHRDARTLPPGRAGHPPPRPADRSGRHHRSGARPARPACRLWRPPRSGCWRQAGRA
ncbi:hypothetical protein D3C71_1322720 [compost metagenome]